MIKFSKIVNYLKKSFPRINFEYQVENDNLLILKSSIVVDDLKGWFLTSMKIYDIGNMEIEFIYEKINKCCEVYKIINDFNYYSPFIKAVIIENKNGYFLRLIFKSAFYSNENYINSTMDKMIMELCSEKVFKFIDGLKSYLIYED